MTASPRRPSQQAGLVVLWGGGQLSVRVATHKVRDGERVVGAVYGLLTESEAIRLVGRLSRFDDPVDTVVEVPWAAAALRPDGSLAATCSTMLASGLFWSVEAEAPPPLEARSAGERAPRLILATDPGSVIRARHARTHLNQEYLRDFALLHTDVERTPYLEVTRAAAGDTLVWSSERAPVVRQWCGPEVCGEPELAGPGVLGEYLETFDGVVADLMGRVGPLVSTVSGGLDSTFVVASLAHQTEADRPVEGFVHAPLSAAGLRSEGVWDPDDSAYAEFLAARYPGLVRIAVVRNEAMIRPLDAARAASAASWLPTFNPGNQVWMTDIYQRAAAAGADLHFWGSGGNHAFSFGHSYAAAYYLGRGRPLAAARTFGSDVVPELRELLGPGGRSVARTLLTPMRRARRRGRPLSDPYDELVGMAGERPSTGLANSSGRAFYLSWLFQRSNSLAAAWHPAAQGQAMPADPFSARPVLDLAARIAPAEWRRGYVSRAFARRAGAGRVPDEIRLRRRHGGQARDNWFWIRNDRERYLDEVALLDETPALAGYVDVGAMRARVLRQPWGSSGQADFRTTIAIDRLLSLAAFSRAADKCLARLNAHEEGQGAVGRC